MAGKGRFGNRCVEVSLSPGLDPCTDLPPDAHRRLSLPGCLPLILNNEAILMGGGAAELCVRHASCVLRIITP